MRRTLSVPRGCVLIQLDIFVMVKLREPVNFSECFEKVVCCVTAMTCEQ